MCCWDKISGLTREVVSLKGGLIRQVLLYIRTYTAVYITLLATCATGVLLIVNSMPLNRDIAPPTGITTSLADNFTVDFL